MTALHLSAVPSDPQAAAAVADLYARGMRACDAVRWFAALRKLSLLGAWAAVMVTLRLGPDEAREWLDAYGEWTDRRVGE